MPRVSGLENFYRKMERGEVALLDAPEPESDYDSGSDRIPFTGAQVGWSPLREGDRPANPAVQAEVDAVSVAVGLLPDGALAIVQGVCTECKNGYAGDPIFGRRVCLGCGRERR